MKRPRPHAISGPQAAADSSSLRRTALRAARHAAIGVLVLGCSPRAAAPPDESVWESAGEAAGEAILDDLGRRALRCLLDGADPRTGLVLDRLRNLPAAGEERGAGATRDRPDARRSRMASIASCGYLLSALPEAVRIGELDREAAAAMATRLLSFVRAHLAHHHGLLYHFVDRRTGERWGDCEVSLLDSAIFFNGCMVAAQAFGGEIAAIAGELIDRAEWSRFIVRARPRGDGSGSGDGREPVELLALGWKRSTGLLGAADVRSSEMAMAYFLAIGSRTDPIDPRLWHNTRIVRGRVAGIDILNPGHPLFTSFYGLAWHDLEGIADRDGVDLFENARRAALANRAFCRSLAGRFETFGEALGGWWGISAGDSQAGYVAPGPRPEAIDGTVWPLGALGAVSVIPRIVAADVERWRRSAMWPRVAGRYGLSPFNAASGWIGADVIGIDAGSFLLALANRRAGTVWRLWRRHPVAVRAFRRLGLTRRPR